MNTVLFHLTGNANVRAAAYGLAEANLLHEYNVTIASFTGSLADKISRFSPFAEIKRRQLDPILQPYTRTRPWKEMGRVLLPKIGLASLTNRIDAPFFVDAVVQDLDKYVARRLVQAKKNGATAVYGYEDTTIYAFQKAKQIGLSCLYDLPIGYWKSARRLLKAEQERWPEWASTINILHDAQSKLERKEKEISLADHILVASSFTAKSLSDYEGSLCPVHVIPYGFPAVNKENRSYLFNGKRPLKVLFVGSLSQRKGIADVFAAAGVFGNLIELTIVGRKVNAVCPALDKELIKHKWIPSLPHQQILQLMRENDVLLFPSLFEGFGLVITEAMSQGMPVITTDRTAGPDLIQNNENGWLVEAGSTTALINAIEKLLLNPKLVASAGTAASTTAAKRPWEVYSRELAETVESIIKA